MSYYLCLTSILFDFRERTLARPICPQSSFLNLGFWGFFSTLVISTEALIAKQTSAVEKSIARE